MKAIAKFIGLVLLVIAVLSAINGTFGFTQVAFGVFGFALAIV